MEKKYSNKYVIKTGIGLQDVDNLRNSSYFLNETERYLKGEISLDELDDIVASYYESKPSVPERSEEADKIAIRIAKLISEDSFTFSVGQLLLIHRTLFSDVLEHAGELRQYNFSKKEWVLDGKSVIYGDYRDLEAVLQYDFDQEKKRRYQGLTIDETVERLAVFVANLWQIHPFEEGNTRTVAVFFIKYLRSLGFDVTNDTFAENAWYFRNALVRANYTNISKGVYEDRSYLVRFLRNLLLNESNVLKNRDLHIDERIQAPENTRELRVIELIRSNPQMTTAELSKELGVSERTVKTLMKTLADQKVIVRVGGKRFGQWKVLGKSAH